mmetsp:Transcript_17340/g.30035  ORF Transcript_17340/g.30035 Transcript_17340/m.30035 type:complete len:202 (-) Transcript_17340:367-972(-)
MTAETMPAPRAATRRSIVVSSRLSLALRGDAPDSTFCKVPLTSICRDAIGATAVACTTIPRYQSGKCAGKGDPACTQNFHVSSGIATKIFNTPAEAPTSKSSIGLMVTVEALLLSSSAASPAALAIAMGSLSTASPDVLAIATGALNFGRALYLTSIVSIARGSSSLVHCSSPLLPRAEKRPARPAAPAVHMTINRAMGPC